MGYNREKSGIRRPSNFTVLGHTFTSVYKKGSKGQYQLIVSQNSWAKLKRKLKYATKKTRPCSFGERKGRLKLIYQGWINNYRLGNIYTKLKKVDEWLRNRLRCCIWHDWKKPERKRKNLIRLGIEKRMAYAWSHARMGGWAVAERPISVLQSRCPYSSDGDMSPWSNITPKLDFRFNEPPYTRPVRTVGEAHLISYHW